MSTGPEVTRDEYIGLGLGWAAHVLEFVRSEPGVFAAYQSWAARQPDRDPDERDLTPKNLEGAEVITTAMSLIFLGDSPEERETARKILGKEPGS